MSEENFDAKVILTYPDNNKPFLYFGSQFSARVNPQILQTQYGITHILNVTKEIDNFHGQSVQYKRIPIDDAPREQIEKYFDEAHEFIHSLYTSGNGAVLVHCNAGISRSGSIVLSYLVGYHNMNLMEALNHTKQRRSVVSPNLGFIQKLQLYEKEKKQLQVSSLDYHNYAVDWLVDFFPMKSRDQVDQLLTQCNDDVDDCLDLLLQ
jgi:protein-tyrosine phosphatase